MEIKSYLARKRKFVEAGLEKLMLREEGVFAGHVRAMRYSLFVGGKRVRPILCLAAAETVSADVNTASRVLPVACALELIHTYSLIHDDLPAMDDDDLRRGRPTNHKVFGEAEAILAGDGLLTLAFEFLSDGANSSIGADVRLEIIHTIATAAGSRGMVGGQALDIDNENNEAIPYELLRTIHASKTGALITASVKSGALAAGAEPSQVESLSRYGKKIGLAFQIADDLLNVSSTTEQLGKAAGSDAHRGKSTYPAFFGMEKTRALARETVDEALAALADFDHRADPLRSLAEYIINRDK